MIISYMPRIYKRKFEVLVLLVFVWQWSYPGIAIAAEDIEAVDVINQIVEEKLPEPKVVSTRRVTITAYSSTVDQCDDTPCITANGFDLCEHNQENVVAANFLPFGAKIRIPEYFGDRIFTVQDRMNARYYYRVDVWMKTRQSALNFGIRNLEVEVLE